MTAPHRDARDEVIERLRETVAERDELIETMRAPTQRSKKRPVEKPPGMVRFSPLRPIGIIGRGVFRFVVWASVCDLDEDIGALPTVVGGILSIFGTVAAAITTSVSGDLRFLLFATPVLFWPIRAWARYAFHLDDATIYERLRKWSKGR